LQSTANLEFYEWYNNVPTETQPKGIGEILFGSESTVEADLSKALFSDKTDEDVNLLPLDPNDTTAVDTSTSTNDTSSVNSLLSTDDGGDNELLDDNTSEI